MRTTFSTERLALEQITEQDDDFVLSIVNSKGWLQFIGDRNVHSKKDAVAYIKRIKNTPDFYYWVVKLKGDKTPIGIVSFLKRSYLEGYDLGFAFLPEFNGYGYAYEAAEKVLSVARKKPQYAPVLAITVPENTSSTSLLVKLGFNFEKELIVRNEKLHLYSNPG